MRHVRIAVTDRRRRLLIAACLLLLAAVAVRTAPPDAGARVGVGAIHMYQAHLSPWIARAGVRCRFSPTCSRYTEQAIRKYGLVKGTALGAWRILRCGPWTPVGTVDYP